ncbi:MAG: PilN domain-containing protein [Candidatus Woykebacteria bacterium]
MARSAQKQPSELNINLMPKEELGGTFGETIHWVLTIGRYLIIATEIVALVTFGLSLKLTVDKNNLNNSIKNAQGRIDSKSEFEATFREVQKKLDNIKGLRAKHVNNYLIIQEFNRLLPEGLTLEKLELSETGVTFSGSFPTASQLQTLINSFNRSDKIHDLEITSLNSPSANNPKFTLSASAVVERSLFNTPVPATNEQTTQQGTGSQ